MKKWSLTGALLLATTTPAVLWSWGANAATAQDWRSRSIYQVITDRFARADGSTTATCNTPDRIYCGGSYRGIVDRLDYIQGMGFTAIWISPITYNFLNDTGDGTSYHGYWQQNLYELNPNFGPAEDLRALSDELHRRGMYLMVDVVVNHNGWDGGPSSVDYSQFYPFNSSSYFHPYCPVDYNDQGSVENCWLGDSTVTLPDLKTEDPTVAGMYNTWIGQLVANYSIDGLRIDTVKHVDPAFWPGFNAASAVFSTGEVFDGDPSHTCSYQQYLDSLLNYPIYYPLLNGFKSTSGSTSDLVNMINSVKAICKDSTLLGSFSENHDNPRFASYTSDLSLARNVIAYTILADGVPIIYQGQEQHYSGGADPENREAVWLSGYDTAAPLYTLVAQLNQIRNRALRQDPAYLTYQNWAIYSDPTTIAMRKGFDGGQIVAVLSNKGAEGAEYTLSLGGDHGWDAGTAVMEVLGCTGATVDGSARLQVPMESGLPRVYYPVAQLTGSGICGL